MLKTDFCFAAGDELADRLALDEFGFDIPGDTEALKEADQIAAARASRIAYRFGGEQRALESFNRTYVGSRRTSAHRHTHARFDEGRLAG